MSSDRSRARAALVLTTLFAGALFWLAPRPPMGDLPQHAGQIAVWHDLLIGQSPWAGLVQLNYFTPYLLPYGLATLLSFFMPVLTALKLILTLSFYGFVLAAIALREELHADARLDWLLIPGFFGFAFYYGFYPFLVGSPLGLSFILVARRSALNPSLRGALGTALAGALLFFSHGLVFLFAIACGLGMALVSAKKRLDATTLGPYVAMGALAVAYSVVIHVHEPAAAAAPIDWEWGAPWGWHRLLAFPLYPLASTPRDLIFFPAVLLMFAAPWLLGAKLQRERAALVPLAVVLIIGLAGPASALKIDYLYQRFALFLLPAYALAFCTPEIAPSRADSTRRPLMVQAGLALLCWFSLGTVAVREVRFARESAPFEDILGAAEPGARAMALIYDPASAATLHPWGYSSYALWYQAERKGFVDFNFASFVPEVVRYRPEQATPYGNGVQLFEGHRLDAPAYRYFFVQHAKALPSDLFASYECDMSLRRESGEWSLFERRGCH